MKLFHPLKEKSHQILDFIPIHTYAGYAIVHVQKVRSNSLYVSSSLSSFYGTEYQIWASFELVGSTEDDLCPKSDTRQGRQKNMSCAALLCAIISLLRGSFSTSQNSPICTDKKSTRCIPSNSNELIEDVRKPINHCQKI